MNRQYEQSMHSLEDGIAVGGDNGASFPLQLYLGVQAPGDRFFSIACDRARSDEQPLIAAKRIAGILKEIETGDFQKRTYGDLVTSPKYHGPIKSNTSTSWSVKATQASTKSPWRLVELSALSKSSSLSLKNDSSKDGRESSSSSAAPGGTSAKVAPRRVPIRPLRSAEQSESRLELEPLIFTSIRQILSTDPSYAEEVVSAVKQLPNGKRNLFLRSRTEPANNHIAIDITRYPSYKRSFEPSSDLSAAVKVGEAYRTTSAAPTFFDPIQIHPNDSGSSHVAEDGSGSPSQAPSGQPSTSKGVGNKTAGQDGLPKSSAGKSKKRHKSPDDDDDDDDDGKGDGGGSGESTPPDKKQKSDVHWACPYCLAYAHILYIPKFATCRSFGYTARADWRLHLNRHHSPEARRADPDEDNALFYMDAQQWTEVQKVIDAASRTRPRRNKDWFEVQKTCYLAVWRIIFPTSRFPRVQEPVSPFHPDRDEIANLPLRGRVLFKEIYDVNARRAVTAGSILSTHDFRPTHEEYLKMMSEAFAIVTSNLPSAAQWVVNASSQALQTAVADHADQVGYQPLASVTAPYDQPLGEDDYEPVTTLEPTPEPRPPEPAPRSQTATQETPPMTTTCYPLYLLGTRIDINVIPNYLFEPGQQPALLLTYPAAFDVQLRHHEWIATSTMDPVVSSTENTVDPPLEGPLE